MILYISVNKIVWFENTKSIIEYICILYEQEIDNTDFCYCVKPFKDIQNPKGLLRLDEIFSITTNSLIFLYFL